MKRAITLTGRLQLMVLSICASALLLSSCATIPERNPLPVDLGSTGMIPGIPDARFWGDEWPDFSLKIFDVYGEVNFREKYSGVYKKPHAYLAISGGGANGAFGAGLLAGWSASGTRPEFTMVTGISTGALTAPFAFLGSDYDTVLTQVYTTTATKDIVEQLNFISALFADSLVETNPLHNLIAHYVTDEVVTAIAKEYLRGRRLFLGTFNLDASRPVIWNIGAIAASDHPQKLKIIHTIMLASASIPVAFPPVIIPVEAAGETYDEMHVDGGVGSQVFVYPASINWRLVTRKLNVQGKPKVYVIRNSFLNPEYSKVQGDALNIASRSIDSLIRTQGIGDIYQIYSLCQRDGNDFNLAFIPSDFDDKPAEAFDPVYMKKLFQRGYDMGLKSYHWEKVPPGFSRSKETHPPGE